MRYCVCIFLVLLSLFTVSFVVRAFSYLLFARAYIIVSYSDVGRVGCSFIFLAYTNVGQ